MHGLRRSQYRSPWAVDRMPHTRSVGSRSQGDETGSVSARSVWQDGARQAIVRAHTLQKYRLFSTKTAALRHRTKRRSCDRRVLRNSAFGEARPNALKSYDTALTHGGQQVFRLTPRQFPATFATCLLTEMICNDGLSPQRSYRLGAFLGPRRRSRGFGYPFLFHPSLPQHTRVTRP